MIIPKTTSYKHSQGAVLIVSLILLLVMTLVGIAAIDSSTLQSQMARNSLFAQSLYQKSRSEIEAQLYNIQDLAYLKVLMTSTYSLGGKTYIGIYLKDTQVETYDPDDAYSQSAQLIFKGNGTPPSGYSLGLYVGKNYEFNAVSEVTGTGSISDQTQGMSYPAPM